MTAPLRPPIDPELVAHLPAEPAEEAFMADEAGFARLRAAMAEYEENPEEVAAATGIRIDEIDLRGVPSMVIRPAGGLGDRAAVLNVHGGGLVAGSHRSVLTVNALLARELGCVMVVPDYRLAPEHRYPAALDDVEAVWNALVAGEVAGVDTDRLVVVGGSSGGGLAAALVIRLRRLGRAVPRALALIQPQLDDRNTEPSTFEWERAPFWDRLSNVYGWSLYLDGAEADAEAAPARASDLTGFPPTFIEIAQADLFRDEELSFAARLSRSAVPVEAHLWSGAFHGFDGITTAAVARRAVRQRTEFLRTHLG